MSAEIESEQEIDHVVLIHGIKRSSSIMDKMANYLQIQGYRTHNIEYDSTQQTIQTSTKQIFNDVVAKLSGKNGKIHFVGHSMGGIIIRNLLSQHDVSNLGRVALLAPPNKGTTVVDFLKHFGFYKTMFGPAGMQLGSKKNTFLEGLPKPNYDVGIIAGNRSVDFLFSWFLLRGENDGKVTIESTRLEGMKDHVVLPVAHPFLPGNAEVMQQTAFFLAHGYFQRFD